MSQKAIKLALVSALALSSMVQATEFRSPLLSERGPLRYIFTKEKKAEDKLDVSIYSAGYGREADKAYIKHGFGVKELTQLYFGKSDFRLAEALPNSYMAKTAEFYNPLVQVLKISPRASYTEKGMMVGTRIAYPLKDGNGSIGMRVNVPFRTIDIQRNDQGDRSSEQLQDVVVKSLRHIGTGDAVAYAWRADLVNALIQNVDARQPVMATPSSAGINLSGNVIGGTTTTISTAATKKGIIASPEGLIPRKFVGVVTANIDSKATAAQLLALASNDTKAYVIDSAADYASFDVSKVTDIAARLSLEAQQANLWFTTGHNTADGSDTDANSTNAINKALTLGYGGENTYEWLADRGFSFETARQVGLGDTDVDFFYELPINDELVSEFTLGFRLPTGGNADYLSNPYRSRLGNAGHFELKLGAMVAYELADWANLKADAYYSFVLSKVEQRAAMFTGAQVRNIGPRADATVDWGYFVGRLDFTLFHPKTNALSSVFGYEFYAKGKDNVKFKNASMNSWMGRNWSSAATFTAPTDAAPGTQYVDNLCTLDNTAAAKGSDAFAHKVRFETSYRFSNWFECFCGGAYTFAGQNTPRETDMHCGMNITY